MRNAGSGMIIPACAKRRALPNLRPNTGLNSSPSAAIPIRPNGFGRNSGTVTPSHPMFSPPLIHGSSCATGFLRSSRASPIQSRSNAASAPPATKPFIPTNGGACQIRNSYHYSIPLSPNSASAFILKPAMPLNPPVRSPWSGRKNWACRQEFPSRLVNSTFITAPSGAAWLKALWSR